MAWPGPRPRSPSSSPTSRCRDRPATELFGASRRSRPRTASAEISDAFQRFRPLCLDLEFEISHLQSADFQSTDRVREHPENRFRRSGRGCRGGRPRRRGRRRGPGGPARCGGPGSGGPRRWRSWSARGRIPGPRRRGCRRRPPSRTRRRPRRSRWRAGSSRRTPGRVGRRRRRRNGPGAAPSGRSSACGPPGSGPCARKRVPTGSPARIRVSGSGFLPEAMMTEPPACVTSRAASSLLRIPPVPRLLRLDAGQAEHLVVELRDQRDDLCPPLAASRAGVGPVQAVDHAEDDQQRRLEQVRHHRGEPVVVAELDLVDADRVVLVDDRDGVPLEQRGQGVPHVQVARAAVEVLVGQQELGGVPAVPAQALVVGADQVRLADGGRRLELAEVVGPPAQAELADPRADRPRADQRDLAARRPSPR